MKNLKESLAAIIVTIVLIAGICAGTVYYLSSQSNSDVAEQFLVNQHGQTYGSSANCNNFEEYPDLIAVMASNGKEGYIYFTDSEDHPSNMPESVEAYMEELKELKARGETVYRRIPVYESDGKTVIGEFEVSIGESFILESNDPESIEAAILEKAEQE